MTLDDEPLRRALAMALTVRQVLKDLREDDPGDDEARVGPLVEQAASLADDLVKALRRLVLLILAGTMVVQSSARPSTPAEAVRVLRASHSLADRTDARSYPEPTPSIVIRSSASDGPFGVFPKYIRATAELLPDLRHTITARLTGAPLREVNGKTEKGAQRAT